MAQDVSGRADRPSVWFVGDLDDPWVAAIADALRYAPGASVVRLFCCAGDLPETLWEAGRTPDVLALHRAVLTRHDAERLTRWRSGREGVPRVVLCVGPYVRYADLERWAGLVDVVLPEATARDTLASRLDGEDCVDLGLVAGELAPDETRPRVNVVSTNAAMRQTLAEAVESLGYRSSSSRDWSDAPEEGPSVWDVPVLEPGWTQDLARRARVGPVVALIGFPDRGLAAQARGIGAVICLELPFDLRDLAAALALATASTSIPRPPTRNEPPHVTPPAPASRRVRRAVVGRGVPRAGETPDETGRM